MASAMNTSFIVFFLSALLIQGTLGEVICEDLPENLCSFAIASSGKRCALETSRNEEGKLEYMCTSSEIVAERFAGYIETDSCVAACGVDRKSVGISSDAFLAPEFLTKLCSPECFRNCRNVVDLYFNLAAGEGVYLPRLCQKQKSNPHRAMQEILSSGAASDTFSAASPAMAPAPF